MAKEINKKEIATGLLQDNPEQNKVWITDDGQGFFKENYAKNNASDKNLEDPEVFFREGHQNADDQDLEEILQETEEALKGAELILDRVIDAANVDAEETPEVLENDHAAVKAVAELRTKFEANIEQTNSFKLEIKEELDFNTAVIELIKNDTTKLADAIRSLIPVKGDTDV